MPAPRYLAALTAGAVVVLSIVTGLSIYVDPFGVLPLARTERTAGWIRLARNDNDRLVKPFDPVARPAQAIYLGSSRVKQGFDPQAIAPLAGGPVYNAALDSGGLRDSANLADWYFRHVRGLRHVYIELFALNAMAPRRAVFAPLQAPQQATNLLRMLVTGSALSADLGTLYVNAAPGAKASAFRFTRLDGFYPVAAHPCARCAIDAWVDKDWVKTRPYGTRDTLLQLLRLIRERGAAHGVEVTYFLSPFHSWALYTLHELGNWQVLETLKRDFAALGGVHDFLRYNEITDEPPAAQMAYWHETWHFKPETGRLMAAAMIDRARVAIPDNFGRVLDPKTIDAELAAFRAERDAWIARHPDVVARYRRARGR